MRQKCCTVRAKSPIWADDALVRTEVCCIDVVKDLSG